MLEGGAGFEPEVGVTEDSVQDNRVSVGGQRRGHRRFPGTARDEGQSGGGFTDGLTIAITAGSYDEIRWTERAQVIRLQFSLNTRPPPKGVPVVLDFVQVLLDPVRYFDG